MARLTFGVGTGWVVAAGLFAFAFGYLTEQMSDFGASTAAEQAAGIDKSLTIFVQMNALLAAAAGTQLVQWFASEEVAGRVGYALASPVSRRRWWASATLLVGGWSLVLLVGTSLATAAGLATGFGETRYSGRGLSATLTYAPAVLLLVVLALVLNSLTPRAVVAAWLAVAWGVIVCLRADFLDLPDWSRRLSPLQWLGAVPRDGWDRTSALVMVLVAGVLAVASAALFQRRDLRAG
jgi:ABC-2 type transport system permease protein